MSNRIEKPMLTSKQLVRKKRDDKGITFKYVTEEKAEEYLTNVNNYMRTASYRQNYQKYLQGTNKGKYIELDFAYLQELSTIDMHFRFLVSRMCIDIEQALKVKLIRDIGEDNLSNGYDIVEAFLSKNPFVVSKLEAAAASPFTGDLICKYFTIHNVFNSKKNKYDRKIVAYDDCPVWVLCEILTFGDFLYLYEFYYQGKPGQIPTALINLVRSLRNGTAHNNCILANLRHGTSMPPRQIREAVKEIPFITTSQRQKKLSCRPMLEFVTMVYLYNQVVTEKVKYHRIKELKRLFFVRMPEKKGFFEKNELIRSNYEFACKIIQGFC